jgi:hypothetical protein
VAETSGEGNGGELPLVVVVVREQPQQRMDRQFQRRQREREQQEQQQLRSCGAGRLVIGPDFYSFHALWEAYRTCRRNKRNSRNALAFEIDAEARLLELQRELREHTYRPGRSICFVTSGPKPREVFAAEFRDRIVHHLLVHEQERIFEPLFIHDSYACRSGKGTLAASDRLMIFLRRVSANGRRRAWALKLDVSTFFPTIASAAIHSRSRMASSSSAGRHGGTGGCRGGARSVTSLRGSMPSRVERYAVAAGGGRGEST